MFPSSTMHWLRYKRTFVKRWGNVCRAEVCVLATLESATRTLAKSGPLKVPDSVMSGDSPFSVGIFGDSERGVLCKRPIRTGPGHQIERVVVGCGTGIEIGWTSTKRMECPWNTVPTTCCSVNNNCVELSKSGWSKRTDAHQHLGSLSLQPTTTTSSHLARRGLHCEHREIPASLSSHSHHSCHWTTISLPQLILLTTQTLRGTCCPPRHPLNLPWN